MLKVKNVKNDVKLYHFPLNIIHAMVCGPHLPQLNYNDKNHHHVIAEHLFDFPFQCLTLADQSIFRTLVSNDAPE